MQKNLTKKLFGVLTLIFIGVLLSGCMLKPSSTTTAATTTAPVTTTAPPVANRNEDIYAVYTTYLTYVEERGIPPLTYEEWLAEIKGEKGDKGEDGITPTVEISSDGYWVINGQKTPYRATGTPGKDGTTPTITVSLDGYWVINGTKTVYKAIAEDGEDGKTPILRINETSNEWEVSYDNGESWTSLGVKASGADGEDGEDGEDGQDGIDGKTPTFKVENGELLVSYDDGETWASLGNIQGADGEDGQDGQNGQDGADGKDGEDGQDGIDGKTPTFKVENGELLVSYDDGKTWASLGNIQGADGEDGQDGVDGKTPTFKVENGELMVSYDDGETWASLGNIQGADGEDGQDGANGADGKDGQDGEDGQDGIDGKTPTFKVENGELMVSYDGGETWASLGNIQGADGEDGQNGQNGADGADGKTPTFKVEDGELLVSYDDGKTWASLGNIQGADGGNGQDGQNGQDGANGADGKDGQDGEDGQDGIDGKTPTFKVENGELLVSYDDGETWASLGNIQGADGKDGQDGQDGANGADGKDGQDGEDGQDGIDGKTPTFKVENGELLVSYDDGKTWASLGNIQGADGEDGQDGANGADGVDGVGIQEVYFNESRELVVILDNGEVINLGRLPECTHSFGEWEVLMAPSCTSLGYQERSCTLCGDKEPGFLAATGHTYSDPFDLIDTCTSHFQARACVDCGASITVEAEAKGHDYIRGVCRECGAYDTEPYNGSYGYEYLGGLEDGDALQILYERIDKEAKDFHVDPFEDAEGGLLVTLDFSALGLTYEQAIEVWNTYRSDNPLYYWMSNTVSYTDTAISIGVIEEYKNGTTRTAFNETLYEAIGEYLALAAGESDPYFIALAYHDAIIDNINYLYKSASVPSDEHYAHSIVGVFDGRWGVCESYARAFQLLLNASGVENLFVTGTGSSEAHAWNLVRLADGEWYWCDLTWDDVPLSKWGISYTNFLSTDATFLQKHTPYTPEGSLGEFQYALPARADSAYTDENALLLGDTLKAGAETYEVVGYRAVALIKSTTQGAFAIPERVSLAGYDHTVLVLGSYDGIAGKEVFYGGVTSVSIPKTVSFIWDFALRGTPKLESITVDEENLYFTARDGVLYTKTLYTLVQYPTSRPDTAFVIPDETEHIGYWAIEDPLYLKDLTIGKKVDIRCGRPCWGLRYDVELRKPYTWQGLVLNEVLKGQEHFFSSLSTVSVVEGNPYFTAENGALYNPSKTELYFVDRSLTSITIPASVTSIGAGAFKGFSSPFSITFAEGSKLTSIDRHAFEGCKSLESIILPENVTSISYRAFYGCTSLTSITIPKGVTLIENGAFYGCKSLTSITIPEGVTSIGYQVFSGCTSLTSITIPESVASIGQEAFYGCTSLSLITIPESVTSIGNNAFSRCALLTNVTFAEGSQLTLIGSSAFSSCTSLTSITIPEGVTSIENSAFYGCTRLASVTFAENSQLTSIGSYAFQDCTKLAQITIPAGVTEIGNEAFQDCTSLFRVENHSDLSLEIGKSTYGGIAYYAKCLVDKNGVTYANGVTEWFDFLFIQENGRYKLIGYLGTEETVTLPADFRGEPYEIYRMRGVKNVILPEGITSIGSGAFQDCASLTSITIPASLTSIGSRAFWGCTSLADMKVHTDNTSFLFEDGILYNKEKNKILFVLPTVTSAVIPAGVALIEGGSFYDCTDLTTVTFTEDSQLKSIGGYAFYGCTRLATITIPEGVTSIGSYAFYGCRRLTKITIPEGVTKIENYAFRYCTSLSSITIPKSVTSIGSGAFEDCTNLTTVTFTEDSQLKSIEGYAFDSCTSLSSITIPEGVTKIGNYAFVGCGSLSSITIPASVTSIGNYAFWSNARLSTVYYGGTAEEWESVTVGSYNTPLTNATRYDYVAEEADLPHDGGRYWHYDEDGNIAIW